MITLCMYYFICVYINLFIFLIKNELNLKYLKIHLSIYYYLLLYMEPFDFFNRTIIKKKGNVNSIINTSKTNSTNSTNINTISTVVNKIKNLVSKDGELKNIFLICEVKRIKNYDWCSYLELADDSGKIDGVLPAKNIHIELVENNKIKLNGNVKVNDRYNKLEISINNYELMGDKTKNEFNKIVEKLEKNNIMSIPKKHIGSNYKNIAIITSLNAAGLKDCLMTFQRNMLYGNIIIYPAIVQGDKTSGQVISAIKKANDEKLCDVILIARGGGSIADLEWFNEYNLAVQIKNSKIPITCGIGHEIDKTIVDLVADHSFITPTAAANELTKDQRDTKYKLDKRIKEYNALIERFLHKYELYGTIIENSKQELYYGIDKSFSTVVNQYNNEMNNLINKYNNIIKSVDNNNPIIILNEKYNNLIANENDFNNCKNIITKHMSEVIEKYNNAITPKIKCGTNIIDSKKQFEKYCDENKKIIIHFVDGKVNIKSDT